MRAAQSVLPRYRLCYLVPANILCVIELVDLGASDQTNSSLGRKTLHFARKTLRCSNQSPLFCSHNSWP